MDLALVKKQLRLDPDFTDDDDLIQGYVDAAIAHVEQHCDRVIVDADPVTPDEMLLTKDVQQAILLLVGHWYTNRESVVIGATSAQVDQGVERLLWYRKKF
ncbi:head-tail connector protein [Cupriavidus respiraculi]|uniref:Phage gp6-like head-tail connector protein n=1 Tax=Cupriavidus respiraculi TaxID=195930 RepID=A0ABN7YG18_9BURK|nr:head-tail connector protein [Cupriavidus respiraculi]CAG9172408.1 hypothetical protein LMG21510_01964 [Cupriavidus respiraculi]